MRRTTQINTAEARMATAGSKALTVLAPFAAVLLLALDPIACQAQGTAEREATQELRRLLSVPEGESLHVTRDYSPVFFPNATFYRAERVACIDCTPETAAVVTIGDELLPVTSTADLSRVWARAIARDELEQPYLRPACEELLYQTGILTRADRIVQSPESFDSTDRSLLEPRGGYMAVKPPTEFRDGVGHLVSEFDTYNGFELQRFQCSQEAPRDLGIKVDTLAAAPRGA